MKQKAYFLASLGGGIVSIAIITTVRSAEMRNPHQLNSAQQNTVQMDADCQSCHVHRPSSKCREYYLIENTKDCAIRNQSDICVTCHEDQLSAHPVNQKPSFRVPFGLPLNSQGAITCFTCHRTHGPLRASQPWASVSLLDRLFVTERTKKTYLLRRKNVNGQLCLACHAKEKEQNHDPQ